MREYDNDARRIPHRWCFTHHIPLWVSDSHWGLSDVPCDTSNDLRELTDEEEAQL